MRRTKIVCTIGPACSSRRMLNGLLRAGMDVARLNFSHGTHEQHAAGMKVLRELSNGRAKPLAILQDLCGPKVRVGDMPGGPVPLKRGQVVRFAVHPSSDCADAIPLPVPELVSSLDKGDRLLADDGQIELRVVETGNGWVAARVVMPGFLSGRKGITSPGVSLNLKAVTEKDMEDLQFGLTQDVDWVAASYIRRPDDIAPLREIMAETGIRKPIIAKIEKMEAVRCIEDILDAVDGIMVARGDLGVEIPVDEEIGRAHV